MLALAGHEELKSLFARTAALSGCVLRDRATKAEYREQRVTIGTDPAP